MENLFEKVLISAPTARVKQYCLDKWMENVMNFKYPNFKVRLFDNTDDDGVHATYQNKIYKQRYGDNDKFLTVNSFKLNKVRPARMPSVIERMALSHNDCRREALHGNYAYHLHLETDVFPELDVIERLMTHRKKVVGAMYYRDAGKSRRLMAQTRIYRAPKNILSDNLTAKDDIHFIDGKLKEMAHIGLGCVLIDTRVYEQIRFRCKRGLDVHPDSYFAEDCFNNKIRIMLDTSLLCAHENEDWGFHGIDYI